MIDFAVGTILAFSAWIASWPILLGLIVIGIIAEHNDGRGIAVAALLLSAVSAYFLFGINLTTLGIIAAGYFVVGVIWSFWRYSRYVTVTSALYRNKGYSLDVLNCNLENLRPAKMTDTIVAWIVIWPFSAVENIASDLLDVIGVFVKQTLRSAYNRIYESAIKE